MHKAYVVFKFWHEKSREFFFKIVGTLILAHIAITVLPRLSVPRLSGIRLGQIVLNDVIMKCCFHNILLKPCQLPLQPSRAPSSGIRYHWNETAGMTSYYQYSS